MSDYCTFCETRRPTGGTNHLVLNGGELWLEFCEPCGEREVLTNGETGVTVTVGELFRASKEGRKPLPAPAHLCEDEQPPSEEEDNFHSLANAFEGL